MDRPSSQYDNQKLLQAVCSALHLNCPMDERSKQKRTKNKDRKKDQRYIGTLQGLQVTTLDALFNPKSPSSVRRSEPDYRWSHRSKIMHIAIA